jgi:hypothetical protein
MKRILLAVLALALGACGPKRTSAATQPSPAAFDASASDPKALEIVDAGIAALGGYAKWTAAKEIRFELKYTDKGAIKGWFRHAWDRWNGRHDFQMVDQATLGGDPKKISWLDVKYDLYNNDVLPFATVGGREISHEDARRYVDVARQHLGEDAYLMLVVYKLRDPGVHLADGGEVKDLQGAPDACKPTCKVVKITFDPAVGKDTWFVSYNADSHLPEVIEKEVSGGRVGYLITTWQDAGGLKWPGKLVNIGLPDEVFDFSNVAIGEPQESTYVPDVNRSDSVSVGAHP